jgi:hypothetical protein
MPDRSFARLLLCLLLPTVSRCGSIPFDREAETGRLDPQILSADDTAGVTAYVDDYKGNDNRLIEATGAGARPATGTSDETQAPEAEALTLFLIGVLTIMLSMVGRLGGLRRKPYRGPPGISTRDAITLRFQQPCCSQWVRKAARRWWQ